MRTLRVAVVDDEEPARAALRVLLKRRSDVDIVAECRNGEEAVDVLRWMPIDLLLLDVQMPGLDGFQVVEAIGPANLPVTILITAYDHYAVRAFDVQALDYVLKPFDASRLNRAIDRAQDRIGLEQTKEWAARLTQISDGAPGRRPSPRYVSHRLPVPTGERLAFVAIDEIECIDAADQYVTIHTAARQYFIRQSLQSLVGRLPSSFARVHKSHVVNVTMIKEVIRLGRGDAEIVLTGGRRIRLSRRYRDQLSASLGWPLSDE